MLMLCLKGDQAYTRLVGLQPSGQGGPAIYLLKYKEKEKVFWLINLLTVIQWGNTACIMFFNRETTLHNVF